MTGKEPVSRRDLLRGKFLGGILDRVGGVIADGLAPLTGQQQDEERGRGDEPTPSDRYCKPFPVLRPPGAVEETAFLEGCTRCDECIKACPHGAIVHAPERFRGAAGTPMIDPMRSPCRMCEDFPCISACEPGVLRRDVPVKMGVARVDTTTCLAHQNSFCTVCSEHCPVEGAIEVRDGKPRIVEEACTGCGVCQHVCPAPANAILLMPVAERPLPPSGESGQEEN